MFTYNFIYLLATSEHKKCRESGSAVANHLFSGTKKAGVYPRPVCGTYASLPEKVASVAMLHSHRLDEKGTL